MKRFFCSLCSVPLWFIFFCLPGCMSLEQMAPPVETLTTSSHSPDVLSRGRRLYITACAKCHNVEPIGRYSADRWREILPEMAEESNLGPSQLADLQAYVLEAHRSIAAAK